MWLSRVQFPTQHKVQDLLGVIPYEPIQVQPPNHTHKIAVHQHNEKKFFSLLASKKEWTSNKYYTNKFQNSNDSKDAKF